MRIIISPPNLFISNGDKMYSLKAVINKNDKSEIHHLSCCTTKIWKIAHVTEIISEITFPKGTFILKKKNYCKKNK